ncbi:MAG: hypothetical protein WCR87_09275 [Saccharofermentanales bacterium]
MKKLPIVLVICSLLILMVGCSASPSSEESGPSSAVPSDPSGSEASAEPDITSSEDYTALSIEEKTALLTNNVWRVVGEGNVDLGYFLYSEEDLVGKGYYYRFYDDNTMHEWADDETWNRLYKWEWNDDGTIRVVNYDDVTGESASKWYFDEQHLLNYNPNTEDLTPMSITTDFPPEPEITK